MSENIKFLITAGINTGASIGQINTAIRGLQKQVNSLNLKINIDSNVMNTLNNFNKQMKEVSNQALASKKVIEEAFLPNGTKVKRTYFDGLKGEFSEIESHSKQAIKSMGKTSTSAKGMGVELDKSSKSAKTLASEVGNITKETKLLNAEQEKLSGKIHSQNKDGTKRRVVNTDQNGNVTSINDTEDLVKAERERLKLAEQMAAGRERINEQSRNRERQWNNAQQKAINDNAERERQQIRTTQAERDKYVTWWQQQARNIEAQERKNLDVQKQQNRELAQRVNQFKQSRLNEANRLEQQHGSNMNERTRRQFDSYVQSLKQLDSTMPQVERKMRNLQTGFDGIRTQAQMATRELNATSGSMQSFGSVMMKIPLWAAGMTAIFAPLLKGFMMATSYRNSAKRGNS